MQLTTKVLFVDGKRRIIEVIQLPQKVQLSQSAFNFNEEPPQSYMGFGPIVAFEGIKVTERITPYSISSKSTLSDETFRTIKEWLAHCQIHEKCHAWRVTTGTPVSLPSRLLELGSPKAGSFNPTVRLVIGQHISNQACSNSDSLKLSPVKYATLSHCWGENLPVRLLRKNLKSFQSEIIWESLPRTFQDTVTATHKLGINYLWIDSLCIVQDDEKDWAYEAAEMTSVYLNSYVNISADCSSDSNGGLFRDRDPSPYQSFVVPCSSSELGYQAFCYYPYGELTQAPLKNRAWVVQERFLAPRVVHFCDIEVYWECVELWTSEGLPKGFIPLPHGTNYPKSHLIPGNFPEPEKSKEQKYELWDRIVLEYSSANLSVPSDRSVAIAGLARKLCYCLDLKSNDYVCGLWRPIFVREKMWFTNTTAKSKRIDKGVPSRSWLSTNQTIAQQRKTKGPHYFLHALEAVTELVEVVTLPRSDPFGPVISSYAKIRALMCQGTISKLAQPFILSGGTKNITEARLTIGKHLLVESFDLMIDESSAARGNDFERNYDYAVPIFD